MGFGGRFLNMGVESGSLKAEFWNLRVNFIHVRLDFGLWKSILGLLHLILDNRESILNSPELLGLGSVFLGSEIDFALCEVILGQLEMWAFWSQFLDLCESILAL